MCYGEAVLDFSGIHVACLGGDNGVGKSALLDAITWALWGNSRLGARGDDDLIRLGEDSVRVELTFRLGGDIYRVRRCHKAAGRSLTALSFQILDAGQWRTLVDGGIRATQRGIENALRLDYGTFVNSAFLRQGRADEFMIKTAAERRRVLGSILGLNRWAIYEERAKKHRKAIENDAEAVKLRLEEIEEELGRRSHHEAELDAAQAKVDELAERTEQAQRTCRQMEVSRAELSHLETQIADQVERIQRAEHELTGVAEERSDREQRLAEYEQLLTRREEIKAGYRAYQKATQRDRRLGERIAQSVELGERCRELRARISEVRRRLEMERETVLRRIDEIEGQLPTQGLLDEQSDVEAQLVHLARLVKSREAAKDDVTDIAEERAQLRAHNQSLRHEMEALRERIELLRDVDAQCPLCQRPITDEHRTELLAQIEDEGKAKGCVFRSNRAKAENLAERARSLKKQIADSNRELQELHPLQTRAAALAERLEQSREAAEQLEHLRVRQAELEERLARGSYAHQSRVELKRMLLTADELGYDSEGHKGARKAVALGQTFVERKAQLDAVQGRIAEERRGLERLSESEQRWQQELELARRRRARLKQQVERLERDLEESDAAQVHLQKMRAEEAEARQRLGASQQRLAASQALELQRRDKLDRKAVLDEERRMYDELGTAFGLRGVPAMVIEAAVPEIECEANRLLSRMTDGCTQVGFETQRRTKAGDVREALRIRISDESGTRPYENYSGGEQFRVNFAIRIALSKLLTRRSGAKLRTLIIDEGFGTQDLDGRQRLVEAIDALKDDFARVLVITHIEQLKSAFPTRIEVTRSPEGSVVEVLR